MGEEGLDLEACMSIGPWGGSEGEPWSYQVQAGSITGIVIQHGYCIHSITFQSITSDGVVTSSKRFGGLGGNKTDKILIGSAEYITGVDIKVGWYNWQWVINRLSIRTTVTTYGPFGSFMGTNIAIPIENGNVVGFFGRANTYLNAIGIFTTVKSEITSHPPPSQECKNISSGVVVSTVPRDLGPWGAQEGRPWDDGVYLSVKEVCVELGVPKYLSGYDELLMSVKFLYEKRDGNLVWSQLHGGGKGDRTGTKEVLVGIEGFYGRVASNNRSYECITSLTFHTNSNKYGPYGEEIGVFFSSVVSEGEVVGFCGRSGSYLNAIGVHMNFN